MDWLRPLEPRPLAVGLVHLPTGTSARDRLGTHAYLAMQANADGLAMLAVLDMDEVGGAEQSYLLLDDLATAGDVERIYTYGVVDVERIEHIADIRRAVTRHLAPATTGR